ncbi:MULTISPECIES: hypothetical protein [Streptomyces]|uniref:hypothetical protein n=1 Tax=Streptomyces TaxID=1883 RepID=UPI00163BE26C|nr:MULTISPECIES: hypothetical protein [Streptomyces]MBC2878880.1 hypothetical protein [Streptomyces sp. TYQ1024]UBI38932.1 hypothetical protein K7I03_22405 [Streptomyces mobaraensis]UKW31511.1 hypothetical protein MCU78_22350 [Streptomyces sp. TYQ1024]
MRLRALGLVCGLIAAVSFTNTGCARYWDCGDEGDRPAGLTRQDMVGTYRADPFGTLTLKSDGTFEVSDWPEFDYPNDPKHTDWAAAGTWALQPERKTSGMRDDLELSFTGNRYWNSDFSKWQSDFTFDVTGKRQKPRLYRFTTDPDVCELHTLRHD